MNSWTQIEIKLWINFWNWNEKYQTSWKP